MLRAARVGVQVPGDVTFKEREMGVVGGVFDGGGISTAVVDVASPNARGEQAERGQEIAWRIRRRLGLEGVVRRIRRRLGVDGVVFAILLRSFMKHIY